MRGKFLKVLFFAAFSLALTLSFTESRPVMANITSQPIKKIVEKDNSHIDIIDEITEQIISENTQEESIIIDDSLTDTKEIEIIEEIKNEVVFEVTQQSGLLYANTSVNIRQLPSADAEKLGSLSYAQQIEYTGICDNGWTQVKYNDNVAYINSKYLQETKPEEIVEVAQYSGIIQADGNVSASRLSTIESYYCLVPQNIRTRLETDGWQFICSDNDFGAIYGYNFSILALTVYGDKLIYIDNRKSAEDAIVHEVGHALDATHKCISMQSDFVEAFRAEKDSFCAVHSTHSNNTQSPMEYFAEFFSVMIMNPDKVKDVCPQTYAIIENCINSL